MPRRERDRDGEARTHTDTAARATAGQAATLLGELEAAIMAHFWATAVASGALDGAPKTVAEVQQALSAAGRRSAYTTVMTVMGRLVEKGLLQRSESSGRSGPGSSYQYWPAQSEAAFIAAASRERISALIATFGDVALAQFADALSTLDPERLAALAHLGQDIHDVQGTRPTTPLDPTAPAHADETVLGRASGTSAAPPPGQGPDDGDAGNADEGGSGSNTAPRERQP